MLPKFEVTETVWYDDTKGKVRERFLVQRHYTDTPAFDYAVEWLDNGHVAMVWESDLLTDAEHAELENRLNLPHVEVLDELGFCKGCD